MQTQYERLTDSQRGNIKEYLPIQRKHKYDLRQIVDNVIYQSVSHHEEVMATNASMTESGILPRTP